MMPKIAAVFGTNMDYLYFGRASSASGVPAADGGNVLDRSKQRHANRLIYYYFREEDVDALTDEEFIVLQRKLKNEVSSITGIHAAFVDFYAGVNGDDIRGNGDWTDYQIFKRKNIVDDTSKMWIFDVYERLFTMGKLLGVKHFFDLDCRTAALQSMILMYDGEMHYTGIDDNIFHQYIDNFHTEPEYINEVFRRFTGGKERIRYIKGKYPCPLEIPENNMLLLPFFGLHPNMKVPGFFNAKTHEELLSAMSRDFERVVLMLRGTIHNPELKNIRPSELVYNDIPVEVNCFDGEYDFVRQNMPGFEFYRMGKTKRGNIIIFGTRVPTDRVILEREYTVVGDLLLSYVIDKHWHEMILE